MVTNKDPWNASDALAVVENFVDEGMYEEAIRIAVETAKKAAPSKLLLRYLEMATELRLLETANSICDQWPESSAAAYFSGRLLNQQRSDSPALQRLQQAIDTVGLDVETQIMVRYYHALSALRLGKMELFIADVFWAVKAKIDGAHVSDMASVERYFAMAICETDYKPGLAARFEEAALTSPINDHSPKIAALLRVKAQEFRLLEGFST
jgi:hypothetical protein